MMLNRRHIFVVLAVVLVAMLAGCDRGRTEALRQLYSLDSTAIAQLSPMRQLELFPQLDSLVTAGEAATDSAVLDLSWNVVMYLSQEKKYSPLLTYNKDASPLLDHLVDHSHDPQLREDQLIMEVVVIESYGHMGMNDRLSQGMIRELARARQFDCIRAEMRIHNSLGVMYITKRNYSKGIEHLKQAIELNKQMQNNSYLAGNYSNLAWAYMEMGDLDKAIEQGMVALNTATDTLLIMKCHSNLCTYYTRIGAYDLAQRQVQTAIAWYERTHNYNELVLDYYKYAKLLWLTGHLAEAREYYEQAFALRELADVSNRVAMAQNYAEFCDSMGDMTTAAQLMQYCFAVSDSVNRGNREGDILTKFYEEELEKNDSLQRRYERSERRLTWTLMGVLAAFVVMAASLAWLVKRLMHRNHDQQRLLADMEGQLTKTTIDNAHTQAVLTDLTAGLHSLQKNIGTNSSRETMAELRQMTSTVMRASDEAASDALTVANADFYKRLLERWPRLTNNDLRLCVLLRQGMATKEIADLLCKEVRTVEAARNRLRKKLGLTDRNDDITRFLMQV